MYLPFFLSKFFMGFDSYYFLNLVFGKMADFSFTPVLSKLLISVIPANLIIIKIIMFVLTFVSIYIFSRTSELVNKKYGWLAGLLLLTSLMYKIIFFKFEDDLFGLPFMLLSLYFIVRYKLNSESIVKKRWCLVLSIVSLVISICFWQYSVFFIPIYMIISNYNILYIIWSSSLVFFYKSILPQILPNMAISENMPFMAIASVLIYLFILEKKYRFKPLFVAMCVALAITLLNSKFLFISMPLILLCFIHGYGLMASKHRKLYNIILIIIGILSFINICNIYPNQELLDQHNIGLGICNNSNLEYSTSWSYGYFAIFYDFNNKYYGTPQNQPNTDIMLSSNSYKEVEDCSIITENKYSKLSICIR